MAEITKYENPNSLVQTSKLLHESGMFPGAKSVAAVFCIVELGRELDLPPVVALQNICVVNGKLSVSGQAMLGIALKNDVSFKILEETKEKCIIEFKRKELKYVSTFTIEDANRIIVNSSGKKLSEKDNWINYPEEMLKWRAVSKGLRVIASDFMSGLYTPEEITSIKEEEIVKEPTPEPTAVDKGVIGQEDKGVTEQDVKDVFDNPKTEFEQATQPLAGSLESVGKDCGLVSGSYVNDKITDPQIKAIRTILSSKGIDAFYMNFKDYLKRINSLDDVETLKSMTKKAASELLGNIDEHLVSFFMLVEYHEEMKRVFNFLAKGTKVKILMTLTYFVKDIDSLPKKITEDLSDEYANNYFELFLKAIANQNEGVLPSEHEQEMSQAGLSSSDIPPPTEEPPKEEKQPEFGF